MLNNAMNMAILASAGISGIDPTVRQNVLLAFTIMMLVACVAIIIVIMLQKGTNDNVSIVSGKSDTYYGKNKEKNKESILKYVTLALFIFIMICAIIALVVGFAN